MIQRIAVLVLIATAVQAQSGFDYLCTNETSVKTLPHPEICAKFIICLFGTAQVYDCPPGPGFDQIWSKEEGTCVEGDPINCTFGPVTTTTTVTPETTTTEGPRPNPPFEGGVCEGVNFGLRAHPDYCWKYVWCLIGFGFAYDCPDNQIFSQRTNLCLRGNRVTCSFWRANQIDGM